MYVYKNIPRRLRRGPQALIPQASALCRKRSLSRDLPPCRKRIVSGTVPAAGTARESGLFGNKKARYYIMEKMFLICNAHIDPVWQWEWEEGVGAALSTFRIAAKFCEQYDALVFNHNEALLYKWIEEYEPELFSKITELVKAGRWQIMGGWFLQPDCNMPSGESILRQIGEGRRYFKEKFGKMPRIAINFDPFGHTKGLVQIMAKSGFTG